MVGCVEFSAPVEPVVVPDAPGRFALSLLLRDTEILDGPPRTSCAVPIRGAAPSEVLPPEVGLIVSVGVDQQLTTDETGRGAFADLDSGIRLLELRTRDGRAHGRLSLGLRARRTDVHGELKQDVEDLDQDGNIEEWVMVVEALPDDNGDRISETGERGLWVFSPDGGLHLRHLANGGSERVVLDADYFERSSEPFSDRDGDFIENALDPDHDGDGIMDVDEADELPCPGFSHDDLSVPGSEHEEIRCDECHRNDFTQPLRCDDCHSAVGRAYNDTPMEPPAAHFERSCEQCHIASSPWEQLPGPEGENHESFPLAGLHLRTDCFSCHEAGAPKPANLCEGCHLDDAGVDHFTEQCQICHTAQAWRPPIARHDDFPLSGGHAQVDCEQCHDPSDYSDVSTACVSCHQEDAPGKHQQPGFSAQACDSCHAITTWTDFNYDHGPNWILEGAHQRTECGQCHAAPDTYEGLARSCEGCHETPAFPDHSNPEVFGVGCESCHEAQSWVPAINGSFDHAFWPLENSHGRIACSSCHDNGNLLQPPTACEGCHLADRPQRHEGVFDGSCEGCHQTSAWDALAMPFAHTPSFVLDGIHATTECSNCHSGATYQAPADCISCHAMQLPPNHYGNECATCHTTSNWNPTGELNHHTVDPNAFPLSMSHGNLLCSDCHSNGFSALPTSCESCHLNDQPSGHAVDSCDGCHDAGAWNMPFAPGMNALHPLLGQHAGRACVSCHGGYTAGVGFAQVAPAPACASCHQVSQNHIPIGNTACDSCHSVNGWIPAQGGHQGPPPTANFPYDTWSGRWFPDNHENANQCNDCHTDPGNIAFFSCTDNCHRNQNDLSNKDDHQRSNLFHYDPNAQHNPPNEGGALWPTAHVGCVKSGCHPRGN